MAEQEMEQQDFTEDYSGGDFQENGSGAAEGQEQGGEGHAGSVQDSGAADAPGRDDDRNASQRAGRELVTGTAESSDPSDDMKLFVGGLSWETTEKELREHFSKYGDIESINVKTDPNTGRSRGFAFIVFSIAEAVDKVIEAGDHVINGKKVDPKKAKARHGKIFVGGLKPELSDDDIKKFFGTFGNIIEVEMPFDKQKNQRKGFCFITFDQEAVVTDLLKTPKQNINGHEVDVKKATPKPDSMMRGGMRGGMRARGGIRGRGRGWGHGWNQGGYGGYNQGGYGGYGGYGESDAASGVGGSYDYGGYGGYGGYGDYGYGGYGGYNDYGYGSGNYGYYQAGKGTAGARANTGGSRRVTNRTEWRDPGHDYSAGSWNNGDAY